MFRNSGFAIAAFMLMGVFLLGIAAAGVYAPLKLLVDARAYVATDATVVFREIRERPVGRNRTLRYLYVEYDYIVNGKSFRSTRCTVTDPESISERHIDYWLKRCDTSTPLPIWYDPADPARAIISRRATDQLGFFLLGVMWCGGMAIVFLIDALDAVLWRARRLPGGVFIREQAAGAILHIPAMSPVAVGAGVTTVAGCVAGVVWMPSQLWKAHPFLTWWPIAIAAGLTIGSGVVAYVWERYLARSGKRDLIVDEAMRTLMVPPGPRGNGQQTIGFAAVTDVNVVIWDQEVRTQHGSTTVYSYVPTVVYRSALGGWKNAHLVEWRDEGKAHALAKWLRKRLNVSGAQARRMAL